MNWSLSLIIKIIGECTDSYGLPTLELIKKYNAFLEKECVSVEYSDKIRYNYSMQYRIKQLRNEGLVEPSGAYKLTKKGKIVYQQIIQTSWQDW